MKRVGVEEEKCKYLEQDRWIKEQFICGLDNEGMRTKIMNEIKDISKTDIVTSKQVLVLAKQKEANVVQIRQAGKINTKMMRTSTCKYCGSSHPPKRCPAYGVMCGKCSQVNHFNAVCRAPIQRMSRREEQSNGQINQVQSNHFSHNYQSRRHA